MKNMKLLLICMILVSGILSSSISLAEHPRKEAIETILGKVSKDDSALTASRRTKQLEEGHAAAQTAAKREAYLYKEIAPKAQRIIDNKQGPLFNQKKWGQEPKTIQDQMTLEAAKKGEGKPIIKKLNDKKFEGMEKWEYKVKSKNDKDSVVHYVRDPRKDELMDFKFKKNSTN